MTGLAQASPFTILTSANSMRILFVHQNFPAQYKFLAPFLAAYPENEVIAFTMRKEEVEANFRIVRYTAKHSTTPNIHPWVSDLEAKVIRGDAAFRAALELRAEGFYPDVIIAHPGWGESLFLKEVWPPFIK